ncbi:hypothetical protein, partial [Paraburkholderia sp. SIMBA_027]|uniref:hypothetical protein n=1 Tax=Paraburkholderia sp. SIMBA_027 TaxID=3085770 RepID=UPI0039797982
IMTVKFLHLLKDYKNSLPVFLIEKQSGIIDNISVIQYLLKVFKPGPLCNKFIGKMAVEPFHIGAIMDKGPDLMRRKHHNH